LLFLEPPHFGEHHSHHNPNHAIRKVAAQLGGQRLVASVGAASKQESPQVQCIGVFWRKFATHVNELEIRTHQTVGIQTGGLAAVFADLDGGRLLLSQQPLVLVGTVQTDKFSAHGVGKDAGAAIVVARRSTFGGMQAVLSSVRRRQRRGQESVFVGRFVRQTRSTIGHAVALLAREARKGLVVGRIIIATVAIKDLASVTALGVFLFGKTFRTTSVSLRTWFRNDLAHRLRFVVLHCTRDKGFFLFEFGSMAEAKLIAEFRVRRRLQSFVSERIKESFDTLVGEKSQNTPRQNFLGNGIKQQTFGRRLGGRLVVKRHCRSFGRGITIGAKIGFGIVDAVVTFGGIFGQHTDSRHA